MLSIALLLLPDFLLIIAGFAMCRWTALNRPVWNGAERLVYWLLFPVLLFTSIVRSPLQPAATLGLALGGVLTVGTGLVLATLLRSVPKIDAHLQASGAQVAFRFNSYVALALAERLGGSASVAWVALLIALCVPLCNIGAVWSLARHGGHSTGRELLRNPLILATVAGLIGNLAGLKLPQVIDITFTRIGAAALPLGLMAVGAGLEFGGLRKAPGLAVALLGIRHAVLPLVGLGLGVLLALPMGQAQILVAFAAMPTASSCYVLAARMGGDGVYVAGLVTASTLLGMVSVPVALTVFSRLHGG
ncbi:AEC family transporter [Sphaerotilus sp.]|uniref:AEC family transporter n=1 Tax=Sphaerotilus sp. TaxID=2093942 RepID=UPI003DA93979